MVVGLFQVLLLNLFSISLVSILSFSARCVVLDVKNQIFHVGIAIETPRFVSRWFASISFILKMMKTILMHGMTSFVFKYFPSLKLSCTITVTHLYYMLECFFTAFTHNCFNLRERKYDVELNDLRTFFNRIR